MADAKSDVKAAIDLARQEHKKVLVVVGGDWSYWSRQAYDTLVKSDFCNKHYELTLVNFSPNNKNEDELKALGCPRNLGYPIFIVLDDKGTKLHEQDTDDMKKDKKVYSRKLIEQFLKQWSF